MLTLLLRRLPHPLPHRHVITKTLLSLSSVTPVRDRALDHAVEKEDNLIPLLALKDLLKSSPSNSLPLSLIKSSSLYFPSRPIDFVRRYPSVFEEHCPTGIHPHVKLTPQIISLDEEEKSVLFSDTHLLESADRVLKLLMIADSNKIPLLVIERLRFDLGLPSDFTETLIPNFPDYFRVDRDELELVCRNGDLSVSVIEKKAKNYEKGMAVEFPMRFSRGFEIEKKFKKWVDEWQKLPYVSPYENAMYISGKSDEGDKWVVSVLHEVMSLLYSKKTDRENLLFLGESLGLRTRFKQALLHHPGIFYISRKIGSHTVVLRDGYKRDLLVEKHPLMDIRYKYIHLMNTEKEDKKQKVVLGDSGKKKKPVLDTKGEGEEKADDEDGEVDGVSGSEIDDESEDDDEEEEDDEDEDEKHDEEEEDENENKELSQKSGRTNRGRTRENPRFEGKRASRTSIENRFDGSKRSRTRNYEDRNGDENEGLGISRENSRGNRGRTRENPRFEGKRSEFGRDRSNQRRSSNYEDNNADERRKFSNNNSRGNRGRTNDNPNFEGKRDEFGRDRANERRSKSYDDNNDGEGRKFSNNNYRGNRGRTNDNPRFEGKRVELDRDRPYQRSARSYEAKDGNENRSYSQTNRSNRSRTGDNPRFEGRRDFKTPRESGRDGYQRRTTNYEAKDEDEAHRGNRGRTRDIPRFEGKRDFKNSDQSGRDGSYQRREQNYDSKREGFNGKRNDRGKSKESRYKENSRSGMEAPA